MRLKSRAEAHSERLIEIDNKLRNLHWLRPVCGSNSFFTSTRPRPLLTPSVVDIKRRSRRCRDTDFEAWVARWALSVKFGDDLAVMMIFARCVRRVFHVACVENIASGGLSTSFGQYVGSSQRARLMWGASFVHIDGQIEFVIRSDECRCIGEFLPWPARPPVGRSLCITAPARSAFSRSFERKAHEPKARPRSRPWGRPRPRPVSPFPRRRAACTNLARVVD